MFEILTNIRLIDSKEDIGMKELLRIESTTKT